MQPVKPTESRVGSKFLQEIWEIVKFLLPIVIAVVVIRTYVAQPFIVDGESMAPNFHTGHYLIIDELSYHFRAPKRGEVVVMRYPLETSRFFIKRIIGVPGDTITIKDGHVEIKNTEHPNGYVLSESYQSQPTFPAGNYNNVTLKDGEYFAMGDNRAGSSDSRTWGILPKKDIMGHVVLRLFPIKLASINPASVESFEK